METVRWLKASRSYGSRALRAAVALGSCGGALLILQAWLLSRIVSAVVFGHQALPNVMPMFWGLLAVFVGRAIFTWLAEWAGFRASAGVKLALRTRMMKQLDHLGPIPLAGEQSGELATTVTDGIEALEAYFALYLPQMSLAVLVPIAILATVYPLDWISGTVLLVTGPLIPFFMILIGKGAEALNQRQWRRLSRLSAHFLDTVQGLTELKLFNASRREADMVARFSEEYRKSTMAVLRVAFLSSLVLEFLATVSIAMVAVLIGFRLLWGQLSFQSGFLILLLAPEFYLPLRTLGTRYHARMDAIAASERMIEVLEMPVPSHTEGIVTPVLEGSIRIQVENICFSYNIGRPAIDGISFDLKPGERIALVGPSGAGKSSVFNLLLGFIRPDSGDILVNGSSLAELDQAQWLHHVAWVPQNPRLFHGTVRENIALGQIVINDAKVKRATELALADDFINSLPQGLDTVVGEAGHGLSGGQIQRLALARAFYKNASLVLLDEPGASLDLESERKLNSAIEHLAERCSLITIAHRLDTVRKANRILVINQGRVVETGRHEELVARNGLYRQLVHAYEGVT